VVQINIINYIINYGYFLKHGTTFFSNVPNSAFEVLPRKHVRKVLFRGFQNYIIIQLAPFDYLLQYIQFLPSTIDNTEIIINSVIVM
jgi:hypothetical protein